ncbi:pirin family protein [Psychrobacter sp. DAB_AL62B]|uniref:pirin family protein n=1 Tax=Psychrobacter sp. DAB_AL62B TaxID=1028420 RepID=UPI0023814400|nr:pirin family protein [Psychrobacter sp. DAB_AL62B]MDE4454418.1 pirin family protein [Psychrobacter sp. DAB_AL62B]
MRSIKNIHSDKESHWVGDGFYVKTLVNHLEDNPDFNYQHTDPFLLLDYGKPTSFEPNSNYESRPHGVGQHPHKGFETVTIAYAGEISHSDSTGGYGVIQEGDVQWMTAGRGIMHEEFHSPAFSQRGGLFSMVQLWVNLPSSHKLTAPKYQALKRADLPVVELKDNKNGNIVGTAAIIAGQWQSASQSQDTSGAASTFTAINMWDIALHSAGSTTLQVPSTHNVMLLVQEGELLINNTPVAAGSLIQFEAPAQTGVDSQIEQASKQSSDTIELNFPTTATAGETLAPVKLLLLSGEPIGEPIAGYGPFVMNTQAELKQTFRDYQTGQFGK